MQYKKRNLWSLALAGALALAFASGCNDNDPSIPSDGKKNIAVREWKQIKKSTNFNPTDDKVSKLAVSEDGKFLYAAGTGTELFVADLNGGVADIANDGKWKKVDFANTTLNASSSAVAGKVNGLSASMNSILHLRPTATGVMISGKHSVRGKTAGAAALMSGASFKAAWAPVDGDTHIGTAGVDVGVALNAGVLKKKNGKEYPYVQYVLDGSGFDAAQNRTIDQSIDATGVVAQLGVNYRADTAFNEDDGMHHFASGKIGVDMKSMIITKVGVRVYADADTVGTNTKIADAVADHGVAAAWKMAKDDGAAVASAPDNNVINAVAVAGEYLYIALKSTGSAENTGGVATYKLDGTAHAGPRKSSWDKVDVLALAVEGGKVWAVVKDGLYEAKAEGTKGNKLALRPTVPTDYSAMDESARYDMGSIPSDKITDAKFVGQSLVISTDGDGLYVSMPEVTKTYDKPKS